MPGVLRRLRASFLVALLSAAVVPFLMGRWSTLAAFGILLASWILCASLAHLVERVRSGKGSLSSRVLGLNRSYAGMMLAHCGIAVFVVGVTMVKTYETDKDVKMVAGATTEVGGYSFKFVNVGERQGPNYMAARATIEVSRGGRIVETLYPEKRMYLVQQMPMTEAAIDYGLTRDLYVSLGEAIDDKTWIVRVLHKPFVVWIWLGCVFMALGGALAASDRRYRIGVRVDRVLPQQAGQEQLVQARA